MGEKPLRRLGLVTTADEPCLDAVHDLIGELWSVVDALSADEKVSFETAVAELVANIVQHAAKGRVVELCFELLSFADRVEAHLRDTGLHPPDNVLTKDMPPMPYELAEHGRGLAMARLMVDEVHYETVDGRNHWLLMLRPKARSGVQA